MSDWKPILPPFRKYKSKVFDRAKLVTSFVYQIGESSILRESSREVTMMELSTEDFQKKLQYLKRSFLKYKRLTNFGRGMAAVQVGIQERFFIVSTPQGLLTIINPKISALSPKKLKYPEICMSASPVVAPVIRPAWVEFEYMDENANRKEWITKDDTDLGRIMNRVFQHEIDHLDGIINIDLVSSNELFLESDPKFYLKTKFEQVP